MIKRDVYLQKIINYMWDSQIKVITGIRRVGKSTLLFKIFYDYLIKNGTPDNNIIKLQLDKRKDAKYRNPIILADFVEKQVSNSKEKFW